LVLPKQQDFSGQPVLKAPMDPNAYISVSALWSDSSPNEPFKEAWGQAASGQQQIPDSFPGELEANPAVPVAQGKKRLTEALADISAPSAFLSLGGWLEQSPFDPIDLPSGMPPPGEVTPDTRNMIGHLHYGRTLWKDWKLGEDPFLNGPPQYMAEAHDLMDLINAFVTDGVDNTIVSMLPQVYSQIDGDAWFIWYHFFFPSYERLLTRCEFIALLNELGSKLPDHPTIWEEIWKLYLHPFSEPPFEFPGLQALIGALEDAGSHFSLPFAWYLGDFISVAVIVPAPTVPNPFTPQGPPIIKSPLSMTAAEFQPPLFVGYGAKAFAETHADDEATLTPWQIPLMQIASPGEFEDEDLHPMVFVAPGTNNTYPASGQRPQPSDPLHPSVCDVVGVSEDAPVPNTGEHKRRHMILISLAKLLLGFTLGGPLFGAALAALEALEDTDPDPETLPLPTEDEQEDFPPPQDKAFTIRSEGVSPQFGNSNDTFSYWPADAMPMTVNPQAPPDWFNQPSLRFGVACLNDPFRQRSGKPRLDFRPVTILSLATKLAG
jgi:hypothetical protein